MDDGNDIFLASKKPYESWAFVEAHGLKYVFILQILNITIDHDLGVIAQGSRKLNFRSRRIAGFAMSGTYAVDNATNVSMPSILWRRCRAANMSVWDVLMMLRFVSPPSTSRPTPPDCTYGYEVQSGLPD
jgi:hypothetical protein